MIEAVGVVVPAHNEADLLPACLAAVRYAALMLGETPVHLVVVADACSDRTAEVARRGGAVVVEVGARSVGVARDAGVREVLRRTRHLDREAVWLATTDADTLVPPGWLAQQRAYALSGWDAVVGTVTVADWSQYPAEVPRLFQERYDRWQGVHPHVHGANLGVRAAAYLSAGGFGTDTTAEDHALVDSLSGAVSRILRTTTVNVVTSARRRARAPQGFSHLLSMLAERSQALPGRALSARYPLLSHGHAQRAVLV